MRNWKLPLILLLISAALVVFLLLPEKQREPQPAPSAPVASAAPRRHYSAQEIAQVRVRAGGDSWTYAVQEEEGKLVFVSADYPAEYPMDQTLLWEFIRNSANPLHGFRTVEEEPADLSVYGLDAPDAEIEVELTDGARQRLAFGSESPLGDGWYLLADAQGKKTVCLASDSFRASALGGPVGFRRLQLLPVWAADSDAFIRSIASVRVEKPQGGGFAVSARTVREELTLSEALKAGLVAIEMTEPEKTGANVYNLDTHLLSPAYALCGATAAVAEDAPEDLARYGLDEPVTLELVSALGMRARLHVGDTDPQTGLVYVMRDQGDTVALADAALVSFIRDADYFRFMNTTVWVYDYTQIARVEFEKTGAQRHVFEMDGRDPEAFAASLDGEAIEKEEAHALFLAFLSIVMDGKTEAGYVPEGEPAYTVTMTPFEGESAVVELYEINYRQYAIRRDGGEIRYYCNVSVIDDILAGIAALKE